MGELEKARREAAKVAVRAGRTLGRAAGLTALRVRAIDAIVYDFRRLGALRKLGLTGERIVWVGDTMRRRCRHR